jgi:hypothetical protein
MIQDWRESYAVGLHAATGRWKHGKYEWHLFSFGYALALNGAQAAQTYSEQRAESVIICPEENRLPAARLIGGELPDFFWKYEDVYVWPGDLSWFMAFTHEAGSGLGPYFSRRERVIEQSRSGFPY